MGRKLHASEEATLFSPDAEVGVDGRVQAISSYTHDLQHRIARQLGISTAELRDPGEIPNVVHRANNLVQSTDTDLSRECLELLDVYTRITDPEHRRRCLHAVREVAYGSADEDREIEA